MSDGVAVSDILILDLPLKLPVTAGGMLRAAREREGLHVAALAVSMKVPVKKLEALEADRLDLLPDAVFVRALASSVCRALKIDALPILNLLPPSTVTKLRVDERGLNAPFVSSSRPTGFAFRTVVFKPAVLVVFLLLIAALVMLFYYPEEKGEGRQPEVLASSSIPETNPMEAIKEGALAPVVVSSAAVAYVADSHTPSAVGGSLLETANSSQSATYRPSTESSNPVPAPSARAVLLTQNPKALQDVYGNQTTFSGENILSLKAKGPVWVQVKDGKGAVLFSRTLQAGESANVNGLLPLGVVIGRADMVTADVRGSGFNLLAIAQDNVARFEVK